MALDHAWAARNSNPKPDKALLYFVRVGRTSGSAKSMFVFADQTLLGILPNDSYAVADVDPGRRLLWTTFTDATREVELVPGETYYFEIWSEITPVGPARGAALVREAGTGAHPSAGDRARAEEALRKKYDDAVVRGHSHERAELPALAEKVGDPREGMVRVPPYTRGELEFMETVTSEFSAMGTPVRFRLVADVVVDGRVVARGGALVTGLVREATQAGANDKQGVLEVTVPGLKAVDGSQVPLIAQLGASGAEDEAAASAGPVADGYGGLRDPASSAAKTNAATLATGVAAGLVGLGLVGGVKALSRRGRESYYLAGERLRIWTREEAWLRDMTAGPAESGSGNAPGAASPAGDHAATQAPRTVDARCPETVRFTPAKGYRPPDIHIDLATTARPLDVAVTSVVDFALTEPLPAKDCHGHQGAWRCTFDGWGLTRYLRVGPDSAQPVTLTGRLDDTGGVFTATVGIDYVVER